MIPGARLGPYAIVAPLGAGGMGKVYRATDYRLGRDVAIKVLPAEVAGDTERLARFEREAKLLASLNHSNIAHVYGFESATLDDASSVHFLAMELVEGEDLADRLTRGPIRLDEVLAIARQIAEALEEAHQHGIIHRDLKPANIKLTPDGKAKVLDFGLAKAYAGEAASGSPADLSQSPTLARTGTQAGVILGTAAYMSPEQARGKPVDKRADIWAFGVVLFEMLAGKPLFAGETVSDVLAAVLTREPDWARLPSATPASLQRLLRRCLERDPRRRLHDIADARIELEEASAQPSQHGGIALAPARPRNRVRALASLLLVAAVAFAAGRWIERAPGPAERARDLVFAVRPGGDGPAVIDELAMSRDGRRLVFRSSDNPSLLLREMSGIESRAISGTHGAEHPFISPDGQWLGFFADGKLKKVAFEGGDPITICDGPEGGPGAAWGRDGSIYFTPTYTSGLFKVDADGGAPIRLTTPDRGRGETGHAWADPLPGGTALVFTIFAGSGMNDSKVALLDLRSGRYEVLLDGSGARYVASGHLVFYRRGAHYGVPFDPMGRRVTGTARAVLRNVRRPDPTGESLPLAFSDGGHLAYVPGHAPYWARATQLAWISRDGAVEPLPFEGVHRLGDLSLSPDGQRVAATQYAEGEYQIWIDDLVRGTQEKLTHEGVNHLPAWHPDGNHVGYTSLIHGNYDIWWSAVNGSRPPEPLIAGDRDESDVRWSADGRSVLFQVYSETTGPDLELLHLDAPDERRSLVSTPLEDSDASLSRDGRWLAYRSGDALYVSAFPRMGSRTLISRGAHTPRWPGATRELFFIRGDELMAARYAARDESFEVQPPQPLFQAPRVAASSVGFDVAADGKRFLFFVPLPGQPMSDEIHVRLNGFEELQASPGEER